MNVDGSCHCGNVTYQAVINPDDVVICHCTDCQNISSAPYRVSVPVRAENLHLDGSVSTYIKIGGSGRERSLGFCGVCGSAVYSTSVEADPELGCFHVR